MAMSCIVLYYSVSINWNVERVKKFGGLQLQTEAFCPRILQSWKTLFEVKILGSKTRGSSYLYNLVLCSYQEVSVWKLKRGIRWCNTWKAKFSNVYMLRATSCFRSRHTLSIILPGMCGSPRSLEAECCFTPGKSAMKQNKESET